MNYNTKYKKQQCTFCKKEFTIQNFKKHSATCSLAPSYDSSFREKWFKSFDSNRHNHKPMGGNNLTPDGLQRLSKAAKDKELGGINSKQRLYFRRKNGCVVYLQSSYEIKFAEILEELNVDWCRPRFVWWTDSNGERHRYYPDFKIGNLYIDTKNDYLIIQDADKISRVIDQNKINLQVIQLNQINREYIVSILP